MNKYNFNISQISSTGIKTLDKGEYECVVLSEPKAYFSAGKTNELTGQTSADRFGVRMTFRVVEGEHKDSNLIYSPNFGGDFPENANAKQALMAAYGFAKGDDTNFDSQYGDKDFDLDFSDPTAPTIGDGWKEMKGKRLKVTLDTNTATDGSGKVFQRFNAFAPI